MKVKIDFSPKVIKMGKLKQLEAVTEASKQIK